MPAVAIVGSRQFTDRALIERTIDRLATIYSDLHIVSGGARGADSLAEQAALDRGLTVISHRPEWDRYGRSAGFRRNRDIVENAGMVVAFFAPGPRTAGTQNTVDLALAEGRAVHVYHEGVWFTR